MTLLKHVGSMFPARLAAATLALLILAIPPTALAQVVLTAEPPAPTESDFIHIRIVGNGAAGAHVTAITRLPNNLIEIRLEGVCFSVPAPIDTRADIGYLPVGDYIARVTGICVGATLSAPLAFQVLPAVGTNTDAIPATSDAALMLLAAAIAGLAFLRLRSQRG
jgi:hypothetical protein